MTAITTDKKMENPFAGPAVTPGEAGEVRPVLDSSLADLQVETAHTNRYEFREILEVKRAVLQGALGPLCATPVGATTLLRHMEAQ